MRNTPFLLIALFISLLHLSIGNAQVVVAVIGNIACNPIKNVRTDYCQIETIANQIELYNVNAMLILGGNQNLLGRYETLDFYKNNQAWKNFKGIIYSMPNAPKEYYAYSGKVKRELQRGYYSFDLGTWHFIALNTNCAEVNGCGANSPQIRWLERDLKNNSDKCTLAYWQNPHSRLGNYNSNDRQKTLWEVLYDNKVDIVLNGSGYSHSYKRFTFQQQVGKSDSVLGPQVFMIGTDNELFNQLTVSKKNDLLAVADTHTFGTLFLALYETSYLWWFESVSGEKFQDLGATMCY